MCWFNKKEKNYNELTLEEIDLIENEIYEDIIEDSDYFIE